MMDLSGILPMYCELPKKKPKFKKRRFSRKNMNTRVSDKLSSSVRSVLRRSFSR